MHRHQPLRRLPRRPAAALRPMLRARFGRIVNVASIVGPARQRRPGQLRGLEGGADRLHQDRRGRGRPARRDRQRGRPGLSRPTAHRGDRRRRSPKAIPARRAGTPEEVAACVALPRLRGGLVRDRNDADRRRRPQRLTARTKTTKGATDANASNQRSVEQVIFDGLDELGAERTSSRARRPSRTSTSTRSTWSSSPRSSRTSSASSSTATTSRT